MNYHIELRELRDTLRLERAKLRDTDLIRRDLLLQSDQARRDFDSAWGKMTHHERQSSEGRHTRRDFQDGEAWYETEMTRLEGQADRILERIGQLEAEEEQIEVDMG